MKTSVSGPVVAAVLAAVLCVGVASFLVNGRLGYESRSFKGVIGGRASQGYTLGLKTFYFAKGQSFVADYAANINSGALWFHVFPWGSVGEGGPESSRTVTQSGQGSVSIAIPESGLYRIVIKGIPHRGSRGYDLTYSVSWGVR